MRTSGRDIYVTAGDNFYFTVALKDQQGEKIILEEGVDKGQLNIRINHSVKTIEAKISNGEFSFYVGSDITMMAPRGGSFHYEIKHIKPDAASEDGNQDFITTIIPLSHFIIEETLVDSAAAAIEGYNPEEENLR